MTADDKSGDQLVASIRKTRSGNTTSRPKTAKTSARRATAKPRADAGQAQGDLAAADAYTVGRRVWPD